MVSKYSSTLLLVFLLFLFSCKTTKKLPSDPISTNLAKDIQILSADEMKGREVGTKGEDLAAAYIEKRFRALGIEGKGDNNGNYFQNFTAYEKDPHAMSNSDMPNDGVPIHGKNVVGYIDNNMPYTIVIGAHYDHLGMGAHGSLYQGPAEIHNGADDNASGVAVMLYLAEILKDSKYNYSNYLFIAFSGEERGLWGSNYFVKNPTIELSEVNYMINFDMVGRLQNNKLAINGVGTSPGWDVIEKVNKQFELTTTESGIGPSDHTSFYLQDIPAIHFFTGQHGDYHKPSDDADKINYEGCFVVSHYVLDIIQANRNVDKIAFQKTKDESTETPDFKVTLGVIPDYMFNGSGMRIDGVREGRTADSAGIIKGDIVVRMGDREIVDMMSYMKALGAFEKGESTEVIVIRNEKEVKKNVTFQ